MQRRTASLGQSEWRQVSERSGPCEESCCSSSMLNGNICTRKLGVRWAAQTSAIVVFFCSANETGTIVRLLALPKQRQQSTCSLRRKSMHFRCATAAQRDACDMNSMWQFAMLRPLQSCCHACSGFNLHQCAPPLC